MSQPLDATASTFRVREPRRAPLPAILLGFAAMAPIALGAAAAWMTETRAPDLSDLAVWAMTIWSGAVLAFLAGVRRGLSFRTPGGARPVEIATMLWLFSLAFVALACGPGLIASCVLAGGYLSLAVFDPRAAEHREAPPYFAQLRPVQMLIPLASLSAVIALQVWRS